MSDERRSAAERSIRWAMAHALATMSLLASPAVADAPDGCLSCHAVTVRGVHASIACIACHARSMGDVMAAPAAPGCTGCHPGRAGVLHGPMATRAVERAFAEAAFGRFDPGFFQKSCTGCHVTGCGDCHGRDGHSIERPAKEACHACHRGPHVGAEYRGRAPREDGLRYQRGTEVDGERYLKMRPDVHAERGLGCGDCHTMSSLAGGKRTGKVCQDCHHPSPKVLEHRIGGHLAAMECWACHSAWAAQEYGTFFLRVGQEPVGELFRVKGAPGSEYVRSAYLRRQDAPPLGRNAAGRVSPIRPELIAYYGDLRAGGGGQENVLVAARWRPLFPHTVRRGTVVCEGCHANPRRFVLEPEGERIHRLEEDGMTLRSFWAREGQTVESGSFLSPAEVHRLGTRSSAYRRASIEKWKSLIRPGERSSAR